MKVKIFKTIDIGQVAEEFKKAMEEETARLPSVLAGLSQIADATPLLTTPAGLNMQAVEYFKDLIDIQRQTLYRIDTRLNDWSSLIDGLVNIHSQASEEIEQDISQPQENDDDDETA
jgi:hypothetical protein